MKNLTIRNVPDALHAALKDEKNRLDQSLNQTVIDLLCQRLGVGRTRSNGLAQLAGGWDESDYREFEEATAPFERVDPQLWK